MKGKLHIDLLCSWTKGNHSDLEDWANQLSNALNTVLSQTLSSNVEVNQVFSKDDLNKEGFYVCLIGPDSISDDISSLESDKVIIVYLQQPNDDQLMALAGLGRPFEFFIPLGKNDSSILNPNHIGQEGKLYWLRLIDLAFEIANEAESALEESKLMVFLAEVNPEDKIYREEIRRDLTRRNVTVLPGQRLPNDETKAKNAIKSDLKKASLFVQILGSSYGNKVKGSEYSLPELQYHVAREESESGTSKFKRIVWISPDEAPKDINQNEFVDGILREQSSRGGTEYVQIALEYLKTLIAKEIGLKDRIGAKKGSVSKTTKIEPIPEGSIYLLHDKSDQVWAQELEEELKKNGEDVHLNKLLEQPSQAMKYHKSCLSRCGSVVLLADNASPQWIIAKMKDIVKSPGFGRSKDFSKKMLVISDSHQSLAKKAEEEGYDIAEKGVGEEVQSIKKALQA